MYKGILTWFIFNLAYVYSPAQEKVHLSPGMNNPLLPGYFADPTIKKFGDIYYIYATTDNEMLASGAPTVWYSVDFENWYNHIMEVPSLNIVDLRNFWAPDIIEGKDGLYYLYFGNCQDGCNIYGYASDSPVGPWEKLHIDDQPVIAQNDPIKGFPSLDAQFFKDEDGIIYAYWGTWVHYNHGYAVGILNNKTMDSVSKSRNIPIEQTPNPFEAPYLMKRNDKYILMYSSESCHDETYKVQYSYADNPFGPFKPGKNNPILETNKDGSVHGPGHHSVLEDHGNYYIVYHRHDYPITAGGMSRQVCIDSLIFENDSTISKVVPTHRGIKNLTKEKNPDNIAFMVDVKASSSYQLKYLNDNYLYKPEYAVDENNATMWKAGDNSFPQNLVLDFGAEKRIKRIATQFEFASYYYQYKIEYSNDTENWELYVDNSNNKIPGSPMIDDDDVMARYLKITILAAEKTGIYAAIWNIKVYESSFENPITLRNKPSDEGPGEASSNSLLFGFDMKDIVVENEADYINNVGSLGGRFTIKGDINVIEEINTGIKALEFDSGELVLEGTPVPKSLEWNGAYTVATWVKNPEIDNKNECLASWCDRTAFYLANSFNAPYYNSSNYGAAAHLDRHFDMPFTNIPEQNKWHHIVLTFDGVVEKVYVNGMLDNAQNMMLASAIDNAKIRIGASDIGEYFSGYMASMSVYDYALNETDIKKLSLAYPN